MTVGVPLGRDLSLTVAGRAGTRSVQLSCAPVFGTHPRAADACAALYPAQGDPARVRPTWMGCVRVYDPVTASATGTWDGQYIQYRRTFSNECDMHAATGPVFEF
ncbi:SSI family serine proteinase inhibitor [Streptosporangium amethystogenes]|uniref:SSI family serine proteinase inhibitor n=1 Tax=Streptosporangium amethystogenes TaxID=2002 RepID=UPI0037ABC9B7